MNCPYCKKEIYAMTGLQELQKFQKHLAKCKKHPDRQLRVDEAGKLYEQQPRSTMMDALNIRHESGQ